MAEPLVVMAQAGGDNLPSARVLGRGVNMEKEVRVKATLSLRWHEISC